MSGRRRSDAPRILMTADAVGGVWTYALDLAEGLATAGAQVTLAAMGPSPSADQLGAARAVPGLEVVDTGLALDWLASEPAEIDAAGAALRDLAQQARADLIHLNSPALAAGGGFSAPVVGVCHSCTATWWGAVKDGELPEDFRWRAQALWRGMQACDALIAPSAAFAEATAAVYGVRRPFVVHNGRRPAAAEPAARQAIVFTSGRLWDEGKNVAVLDAAAALAGAPLKAAGPLQGPDGGRIGLGHAEALGRLPAHEVAAWLARAQVYASAALYEPFGLGVLEAAQAGCALVLSDIATFRELWEGAAVFVDPRDPQAYAAAFRQLLADPEEAEWYGRLAAVRAGRFTVPSMVGGVLGVYREIAPQAFPALTAEAAE